MSERHRRLPLAELKPQLVHCWSAGWVTWLTAVVLALQAVPLARRPVAELAHEVAPGHLAELAARLPACRPYQPATQLAA